MCHDKICFSNKETERKQYNEYNNEDVYPQTMTTMKFQNCAQILLLNGQLHSKASNLMACCLKTSSHFVISIFQHRGNVIRRFHLNRQVYCVVGALKSCRDKNFRFEKTYHHKIKDLPYYRFREFYRYYACICGTRSDAVSKSFIYRLYRFLHINMTSRLEIRRRYNKLQYNYY